MEGPASDHSLDGPDTNTADHAVPSAPRSVRRFGTADFLIPALIGIVTLSAAFLAWRSVVHGEKATAEYRNAVLLRDKQETNLVRVALDINRGTEDVASISADLDLATRLNAQATLLEVDDPRRVKMETRAADLQREAAQRRLQIPFDDTYLQQDKNGGYVLQQEALQLDLENYYAGLFPPEPDEAAALAAKARAAGEDLTELIIALALAGLIATIAHVIPQRRLKVALVSTSACIWILVTTVAAVGSG